MPKHIAELLKDPRAKATLVDMEISGNPRSLSLVRRVLSSCVLSHNFRSQLLNDVKLAVSEACTNVIKHAFHFDETKKFDLTIQVSSQFYYVQVIYEDRKFDPRAIPVPDLDHIHEGGLGVYIMRNIMDLVEFSTDPPTGTVVLRMVKMIDHIVDSGGPDENRITR